MQTINDSPAVADANQPVPVPVATPLPWQRAQKMQMLLGQLAMRGLDNEMTSATTLPQRLDLSTWSELAALQMAVWQRMQQQQMDWMRGCASLFNEYNQLGAANTLSKLFEQEYNVFAQFGTLLADQASSFMSLLENTQVDYAYWISQKQAQGPAV